MEILLAELGHLYELLEKTLERTAQPCGKCCECCKNISMLRVEAIELAYIKNFLQDDRAMYSFLQYLTPQPIKIWEHAGNQCPFLTSEGCSIYQARTYQCRVYGHYNFHGNSLLKHCVYNGHSITYHTRQELPYINELEGLNQKFIKLNALKNNS